MVTLGRRVYDLMYRVGAPWEGADRAELRRLVADGRCAPETLRRPGAADKLLEQPAGEERHE